MTVVAVAIDGVVTYAVVPAVGALGCRWLVISVDTVCGVMVTGVIAVGEYPVTHDLDPVEQAAWTQIATLLLNLSEVLTRQ